MFPHFCKWQNVRHFQSVWRKRIQSWKKEPKRCLLAHSLDQSLPVKRLGLVKAKVACLATIIPLAKSPLMGQLAVVAAAWAHSVICDYRGQSDVAGDGECRFTPVENYTSAGLKGLTHLGTHTHSQSCTIHKPTGTFTYTHPVQTPTCTHTYSPKPVGNFIEHKEQ